MKFFESIYNFITSDLWFYICITLSIIGTLGMIVLWIVDMIEERKSRKTIEDAKPLFLFILVSSLTEHMLANLILKKMREENIPFVTSYPISGIVFGKMGAGRSIHIPCECHQENKELIEALRAVKRLKFSKFTGTPPAISNRYETEEFEKNDSL